MSDSYRITYTEVEENCVESQPDYVSGNPDEIQRIFDRLPRFIVDRYNMFVEYVTNKFKKYYEKDEVDGLIESKLAEAGPGEAGPQGPQGEKGDTGAAGVGVKSVTQTTASSADGGSNVVTVTLTDGTTSAFTVRNGTRGSDGATGATGPQGPQGAKGDRGVTGATGEKGEKGDTGEKGADGVSVTHSWNGTTLTVTSASGTSSANLKGEKGDTGEQGPRGEKGEAGKDGLDGADGISVYHSWDGTKLSVTSASGVSSADLKGEKGAKGDTGPKGDAFEYEDFTEEQLAALKGEDGVSPTVTMQKTADGKTTRLWIWDKNGSNYTEIHDGEDGAGAQGDWAENDETSSHYILGRTHWLEKYGEDKSVLAKTNVRFTSASAMVSGFEENSFIEGGNYKVNWDGTEYDCECYMADGMFMLGNSVLSGNAVEKDYPFCIAASGGTTCFVYKANSNTQTVSLQVDSVAIKTYHKLDMNYLPDGIPYKDVSFGEMLPETTLVYSEDLGGYNITTPMDVVEGNAYTVTLNGIVYETTAKVVTTEAGSLTAMGNVDLMEETGDSGEPFVIAVVPPELSEAMGGVTAQLMMTDGTTDDLTLSVQGEIVKIQPVAEECLGLEWAPKRVYEKELLSPTTYQVIDGVASNNGTATFENVEDIENADKIIVYFDGKRYEEPFTLKDGDLGGAVIGGINIGKPYEVSFEYSLKRINVTFADNEKHCIGLAVESDELHPKRMPDYFMPQSYMYTLFYASNNDNLYVDAGHEMPVTVDMYKKAEAGIIYIKGRGDRGKTIPLYADTTPASGQKPYVVIADGYNEEEFCPSFAVFYLATE